MTCHWHKPSARHNGTCPALCLCTVTVRGLFRLFIPYSDNAPTRCVCFTPRGGGQRERATITNVIVRICESLPISPTPLNPLSNHASVVQGSAAAGLITANREVCTNIVCAIPVQVACRHFDWMCSYLCSGWNRTHFSRDVWLMAYVFHLC